jgi:hypothetical protein
MHQIPDGSTQPDAVVAVGSRPAMKHTRRLLLSGCGVEGGG